MIFYCIPPYQLSLSFCSRAAQSAASLLQSATWLSGSAIGASNCLRADGTHLCGSWCGGQHARSPAGLESQCSRCCCRCRCCGCRLQSSGCGCLIRILVILLIGCWRRCRSILDAASQGTESGTHLCCLWRHQLGQTLWHPRVQWLLRLLQAQCATQAHLSVSCR